MVSQNKIISSSDVERTVVYMYIDVVWRLQNVGSYFGIVLKPSALSARLTEPNVCANSVDPERTTYQDLYCLSFWLCFRQKPLFASVDKSKFKNLRVHQKLNDEKNKFSCPLELLKRTYL